MLDKALAVKTLAGIEKYLGEWSEVARLCKNADDEDGHRFAMSVVDPLLDARSILTERVATTELAA